MNCKPGELAYLSSDCVDEGVIVEVLRRASDVESELPAWHCRSRTPVRCTMSVSKVDRMMTDLLVQDRYLRPISAVPVHDETRDEVPA